jgi:hypothetical protein
MHASNKLTAEWFNQIIATLKSDTHQVRGHEKRTEGRVGLRCMLEMVPRVPGDALPKLIKMWVRDISVNGIGLVCGMAIPVGTELIANFGRHGMPPLAVVYKVRYSRQLSSDIHSIGANQIKVINGELPQKKVKLPRAALAPVMVEESPVEG